jgi:hypothetical protein
VATAVAVGTFFVNTAIAVWTPPASNSKNNGGSSPNKPPSGGGNNKPGNGKSPSSKTSTAPGGYHDAATPLMVQTYQQYKTYIEDRAAVLQTKARTIECTTANRIGAPIQYVFYDTYMTGYRNLVNELNELDALSKRITGYNDLYHFAQQKAEAQKHYDQLVSLYLTNSRAGSQKLPLPEPPKSKWLGSAMPILPLPNYSGEIGSGNYEGISHYNDYYHQRVVDIAIQEYEKWIKGDRNSQKYVNGGTGSAGVAWCAYFASWVMKQAGLPIESRYNAPRFAEGLDDSVFTFYDDSKKSGQFVGSDGYQPRVGDIIVYSKHVNIIVGFEPGGTPIVLGGNEGGGNIKMRPYPGGYGDILGYLTY